MAISTILESMWMMVFGNSVIASLAILATFAFLCFKKKYGITETLIVIFPVLIGVGTVGCFGTVQTGCLPPYLAGSVIMGIGVLWGLAVTKAFNATDAFMKIYVIFLCMNAALVMYGYDLAGYDYSTTGTSANVLNESSQSYSGASAWSLTGAFDMIRDTVSPIGNFLLGGGIIGFFRVSGLPTWVADFISYPIAALGILAILPLISLIWRIGADIIAATVGAATRLLRL